METNLLKQLLLIMKQHMHQFTNQHLMQRMAAVRLYMIWATTQIFQPGFRQFLMQLQIHNLHLLEHQQV